MRLLLLSLVVVSEQIKQKCEFLITLGTTDDFPFFFRVSQAGEVNEGPWGNLDH